MPKTHHNGSPPQPSKGLSLSLLHFAQQAIDYLMARGGFVECTKAQFAFMMNWTEYGDDTKPNRRRVEDVCNLTRDQHMYPVAAEALGGYVVAYAPSQGGMTLVDPLGDQPLDHLLHILMGDLQRQQAAKTINRRRQPTWATAGGNAANRNDQEVARLCWQAEEQISRTGFVDDSVIGQFFKVLSSRGLLDGQP